ncbi:MAG: biotin--[acetyl-CoA-carboxylase] ligase [Rhizobiales bacterium]|nr:biotin--[acetyl-CoA-carboxylase] ligase [Hyphomicrobiales bacterium]
MRLGEIAASQGFGLLSFDAVGSTNDACFVQAREGADRLWIVAAIQTAGRGRRGRAWDSPSGNLFASVLLIDPAPMAVAAQIGFVAALALHDAAGACLPEGRRAELRLKWPNDLLLGGAKLAGILVESTNFGRRTAVVVGCGLNLTSHPHETSYGATSLATQSGVAPVSRADAFAALSDAMANRLAQWGRGRDFAAVRRDWLARAAGLGETVRVIGDGAPVVGRLRTMDDDGRLIVDCADGARRIEAGDVFLAGAPAGAKG